MGNVCAVYGGACPLGRLVAVKLILVFLLCLVGSMVIWLAKKNPSIDAGSTSMVCRRRPYVSMMFWRLCLTGSA